MLEINTDLIERADLIAKAETDQFDLLVEASRLDPGKDFREAKLGMVSFENASLSGYDFSDADLRGATWTNVVEYPVITERTLLGSGNDLISPYDRDELLSEINHARKWSDRFDAFRILVDNFGETTYSLDVLRKVLEADRSTYMRSESFLYFCSRWASNKNAEKYAREFADSGSQLGNIFRMRKIRRLTDEILKYISSVDRLQKIPAEASASQIIEISSLLAPTPLEDEESSLSN